jgi:hypothetical protein
MPGSGVISEIGGGLGGGLADERGEEVAEVAAMPDILPQPP